MVLLLYLMSSALWSQRSESPQIYIEPLDAWWKINFPSLSIQVQSVSSVKCVKYEGKIMEILFPPDHWVQAFHVGKKRIGWESCVVWEHKLLGKKKRKKGRPEHFHNKFAMAVVVCWLAYSQFQRLRLDAYREWSCRDNVSLSIHSLFILIGRETKSWPHQNTRPPLSRCLRYLCSVNLAEMVFYREGLLSGIPSKRGLRSELLQRSKGCASRPRPQLRGVMFFFCWEMRSATSETLFHFKSISLKYLLSGC